MSKFFGGEESSEEESSSSDEESDSEEQSSEEEEEKKPEPAQTAQPKGMAAFMKTDGGSDDSDDEDKKRVVRSHRDKKWDQMTEAVTELKSQIRADDWVAVNSAFDNLNKLLGKAAQLVAKEGVPAFYFKALVTVEEASNKKLADKAAVKKLSSSSAKALNGMKQKLRKIAKPYEAELAKIRSAAAKGGGGDDDGSDDDAMDDDDDDDDDDDGPTNFKKKPSTAVEPAKPKSSVPTHMKQIKDYNEGEIDEKLDELLSKRGRKGTNKQDEISTLK